MMLELARELLQRANTDAAHPIPVVFTPSSWALRQEPLGDWIVRELAVRYEIPALQARTWLDTDDLVPLLDGLDEVAEGTPAGVRHGDQRLPRRAGRHPCGGVLPHRRLRTAAGSAADLRHAHHPAAHRRQVDDFLARAGEPVAAVRAAVAADSLPRQPVFTLGLLDTEAVSRLWRGHHGTAVRRH